MSDDSLDSVQLLAAWMRMAHLVEPVSLAEMQRPPLQITSTPSFLDHGDPKRRRFPGTTRILSVQSLTTLPDMNTHYLDPQQISPRSADQNSQ